MRSAHNFQQILPILGCLAALTSTAVAFEGRINAVMIQGNQTNALLYTVGTTSLRVEMTATNWPNPVDILDINSGSLILLFPNNRSYVRLKPATDAATVGASGMPGMPAPPPGIGPQPAPTSNVGVTPAATPPMPAMPNMPALPPGIGPQAQGISAMPPMPPRPVMPNMSGAPGMPTMPNMAGASGMPSMPAMPMPMMPNAKAELQSTGQKTNLLGFACQQYQLKQRGRPWMSGRRTNYSRTSPMCKTSRTDSARNGSRSNGRGCSQPANYFRCSPASAMTTVRNAFISRCNPSPRKRSPTRMPNCFSRPRAGSRFNHCRSRRPT